MFRSVEGLPGRPSITQTRLVRHSTAKHVAESIAANGVPGPGLRDLVGFKSPSVIPTYTQRRNG
jgi:hypothetical protein